MMPMPMVLITPMISPHYPPASLLITLLHRCSCSNLRSSHLDKEHEGGAIVAGGDRGWVAAEHRQTSDDSLNEACRPTTKTTPHTSAAATSHWPAPLPTRSALSMAQRSIRSVSRYHPPLSIRACVRPSLHSAIRECTQPTIAPSIARPEHSGACAGDAEGETPHLLPGGGYGGAAGGLDAAHRRGPMTQPHSDMQEEFATLFYSCCRSPILLSLASASQGACRRAALLVQLAARTARDMSAIPHQIFLR